MAMDTLDIAEKYELALMEKQKPMNAVIDRGDSPVQQFYKDTTVLITGASGFLGKQFMEKIFRACEIKKIYILLRPRKGRNVSERLNYILSDPLYDTLRKKKPNFAGKIVPIEGDVADLRLGLSDKDWDTLTKEVNVIVHLAATVNFDEPLKKAGLINVRGTREMLELGKQCQNLKLFSHISTAFAHATKDRINKEVSEQFYESPVPPDAFIELVENVEEERLTAITSGLIKGWPNTYTFTKAISEELVRRRAGDLPICIVKPAVVIASHIEPTPGWIDNRTVMASPVGFLLGAGLGVMHVLYLDKNINFCITPVDYVNNVILAAGWDSVENRKSINSEIPIYTVGSVDCNFSWAPILATLRTDELLQLSTPKSLYYICAVETTSPVLFWFLTWLFHYIPGYLIDAIVTALGVRPKGLPSITSIYKKTYKLFQVYEYFLFNSWKITDDNVVAMTNRLAPADQAIFRCNVREYGPKDVVVSVSVGLRRYIVKDGLKGSDYGLKKQRVLKYVHILCVLLYGYLIYSVLRTVYSALCVLIPV